MLTMPLTVHYCPLRDCGWRFQDPGPTVSALLDAPDVTELLKEHYKQVEDAVRPHLESHSAEEWAREIATLKAELAALRST